jgi:sigma-B regulation protein RsbU (phosphoserine phosphatase)
MPQDLSNHRTLTLTNDLKDVPRLATFVEEICEALSFDDMVTMQMNLAIEEAVVNVMDYAYPEGVKGYVDIEAWADEQWLTFVITDSGKPFDPTTKGEVDITLSAEERDIGGLGIYLVRQIMDSIGYEYKDGHNVLTLKKKVKG